MKRPRFHEYALLTYSLKHLTQTQKVKFTYALKGRRATPGLMDLYHISQVAKSVLMVPIQQVEQIKEFLNYWNCPIQSTSIYLKTE